MGNLCLVEYTCRPEVENLHNQEYFLESLVDILYSEDNSSNKKVASTRVQSGSLGHGPATAIDNMTSFYDVCKGGKHVDIIKAPRGLFSEN